MAKKQDMIALNLRMEPAQHARLKALAQRECRSLTAQILYMCSRDDASFIPEEVRRQIVRDAAPSAPGETCGACGTQAPI